MRRKTVYPTSTAAAIVDRIEHHATVPAPPPLRGVDGLDTVTAGPISLPGSGGTGNEPC